MMLRQNLMSKRKFLTLLVARNTMMAKASFECLGTICLSLIVLDIAMGIPAPFNAAGGEGACEEFDSQMMADVGWRFVDCVDVWAAWNKSLAAPHDLPHIGDFFPTVAEAHRVKRFPCEVKSMELNDGAGSRTMRYISDWVFARAVGCDWMGPKAAMDGTDSSKLYCHAMVINGTNPRGTSPNDQSARCAFVDWLKFFNLEQNMSNGDVAPKQIVQVRMSG